MPNKFNDEILREFDLVFGKDGPCKNSDSIIRDAGCDDCFENIKLRREHRDFLLTTIAKVREDERKENFALVDRLLDKHVEYFAMRNFQADLQELKNK